MVFQRGYDWGDIVVGYDEYVVEGWRWRLS
jgi:hypothetical protein